MTNPFSDDEEMVEYEYIISKKRDEKYEGKYENNNM